MSQLAGKRAVIVGGTGDIGLATARLLAGRGVEVIITGRKIGRARDRAASLGPDVVGMQVDPGDEGDLRRLFAEVGEFDHLLVTLGLQSVALPFAQLSDADFQLALDGKFFYYTRTLRAALGKVKESVTWLTGSAGRAAIPGLSNYGATCGALHGLLGSLALELAPLRLNCVASGMAKTEFWSGIGMPAEARESMYEGAARMLAVGFVAGPEEIAEAMAFAALNRYTTGTILDTSGGIVLGRVIPEDNKASLGAQPAPLLQPA